MLSFVFQPHAAAEDSCVLVPDHLLLCSCLHLASPVPATWFHGFLLFLYVFVCVCGVLLFYLIGFFCLQWFDAPEHHSDCMTQAVIY